MQMLQSTRSTDSSGLLTDVAWLAQAREVRHPLSHSRPLWVKHVEITAAEAHPTSVAPHPEWHPHCELSYIFQGRVMQYIGTERLEKGPGDVMLLSTGTPHHAVHLSHPLRYVTVYFHPQLLFELAPDGDGARAAARFVGAKQISECVVRTPQHLKRTMSDRFAQMVSEFSSSKVGSELRLRALLIENLVDLLRWEHSTGRVFKQQSLAVKWLPIEKALRYIHSHHSESIYVPEIAHQIGCSVAHLQEAFKDALGMSCIQYLRRYRISHAAALLQAPNARVTEVALAVGFESLGHFNASFRSFFGTSPTQYRLAFRRKQQ